MRSSRTKPRFRLQVVFGDRLLHQPLTQRRGPLALGRRPPLRRQERFQIARPGGVVINALVIHHPGHRIHQISPESNRAQEAVFHLEHRQLPPRGGLEHPRSGSPPPNHHGINALGNPPPAGAKPHLTARQKAAQIALFPRGEAEGHAPPRLLGLQAPLQTDGGHQAFDAAGLMPVGVDATAGTHHRGMHQSFKAGALASPDRGLATVVGQPPAAIERHTEAVNRTPPEQSLKTHLGRDDIHRPGSLEQPGRMATIRTQADPGMGQVLATEMPPGAAGDHIRMHLQHHGAVGMIIQSRLKHPPKTAGIGQAECDRSIPGGLIHHQHVRLLRSLRLHRRVHFAEPLLAPEPLQSTSTVGLSQRDRGRNQLLHPTGGRRIEMHPQLIH